MNIGAFPGAPYYNGRFTNGYNWVDVAARILGQEVDNYAAGGSNGNTAGEITVVPPFGYVPGPTRVTSRSLVQQVCLIAHNFCMQHDYSCAVRTRLGRKSWAHAMLPCHQAIFIWLFQTAVVSVMFLAACMHF